MKELGVYNVQETEDWCYFPEYEHAAFQTITFDKIMETGRARIAIDELYGTLVVGHAE